MFQTMNVHCICWFHVDFDKSHKIFLITKSCQKGISTLERASLAIEDKPTEKDSWGGAHRHLSKLIQCRKLKPIWLSQSPRAKYIIQTWNLHEVITFWDLETDSYCLQWSALSGIAQVSRIWSFALLVTLIYPANRIQFWNDSFEAPLKQWFGVSLFPVKEVSLVTQ